MASRTNDLTITHHVQGQGGKYVAHVADESATGYLEWEPGDPQGGREVRIATHTVVAHKIRNRGVAGHLVERLIADAREEDFLIVPRCSYVEAQFKRNPEWSDLKAG
jgi:hypothetical protein